MTATPGELMLATRDLADAMAKHRNTLEAERRGGDEWKYTDRETAAQAALRGSWLRDAEHNRDRALKAWLVAHGWEQPDVEQYVRPAQTLAEQLAWRASHPLPMRDSDGAPALGTLGAVTGTKRPHYSRRGRR